MPSALIPYCSFGTDMISIGKQVENFTFPICNVFVPTLMDGQLCYELDVGKMDTHTGADHNGGLVLLLDVSQQRSVVLNSPHHPNEPVVNSSKRLIFERNKSSSKESYAKIYINTIQLFQDFLSFDTEYIFTSIKYMTGSDNFLSLDNAQKHCSIETYELCGLRQYVENNDKTCKCITYGHGVRRGNRTKQVILVFKHSKIVVIF